MRPTVSLAGWRSVTFGAVAEAVAEAVVAGAAATAAGAVPACLLVRALSAPFFGRTDVPETVQDNWQQNNTAQKRVTGLKWLHLIILRDERPESR